MTNSQSLALLLFSSLPILFVWAIWKDTRDSRKEDQECEAKAQAWLEEELQKPRFRVSVLTKTSKIYESDVFIPSVETWGSGIFRSTIKNTSLGRAHGLIESAIRLNRYFDDKTNTFIPMCEIEEIRAVHA